MKSFIIYVFMMLLTWACILFFIFSCISCKTIEYKYIKVPYTTPPAKYYPTTNELKTIHEVLMEYRGAIMKISEWENREWINNTNYRIKGNTNDDAHSYN